MSGTGGWHTVACYFAGMQTPAVSGLRCLVLGVACLSLAAVCSLLPVPASVSPPEQ